MARGVTMAIRDPDGARPSLSENRFAPSRPVRGSKPSSPCFQIPVDAVSDAGRGCRNGIAAEVANSASTSTWPAHSKSRYGATAELFKVFACWS